MTILYLIRHSVKFERKDINEFNAPDSNSQKDEKTMLSVVGEKRAEILCNKDIFNNIDVIYASNMVRSQQTAKYLCTKLNLPLNIDERINERKIGIRNDDIVKDWYIKQYLDPKYKMKEGESQEEVNNRMHDFINEVLYKYNNKKIAVFTHGYAITFAILKWCKLENITKDRVLTYSFNNKIFYDKILNAPEVFKLTFDNDKLLNIELIEFEDLPFMQGGI